MKDQEPSVDESENTNFSYESSFACADLTQKLHVQNMITLPKIFSPNLECQDDLKTLLKFPNFFDHGLLSQF